MGYGAEVKHRNKTLSDDKTPIVPVIKSIVEEEIPFSSDSLVTCIFPCAPLIFMSDFKRAHQLIKQEDSDFIYPVTEFSHPIQRALSLQGYKPKFLDPTHELTPTQQLETYFHDVGQFYIGKSSAWKEGKKMHSDGICFPIPNWRAVDIDNEQDWFRAELVYNVLKNTHPNEL